MIKFTDNAFVGGQFFTPGMVAVLDAAIENDLIAYGIAEDFVISANGTVDYATTAGSAATAGSASTAGHATTADSATTATLAQSAVNATSADHATTADSATVADSATSADTAAFATTALSASSATTANTANSADSATTAGHATTADSATSADHATTADSATSATTADSATSATTAGHATTADTATSATNAATATTALSATTAVSADKSTALIISGTTKLGYATPGYPIEGLSSSAVAASCSSTANDEVLGSFTILANTLGVNSILQIEPLWTFGSSANNKILKVKIAGATIYTATRTTSVKEAPLIILANRNSLSSQIQPYDNLYVTAGTGAPAIYAIDFSVNVTVLITGQRANSGDALTLEYYRCLHFTGA